MSALSNQPLTTNLQAKQWFKFHLMRAPSLTYFCQNVNLPRISGHGPVIHTPFVDIPVTPDGLYFEPLTVTFEVDEQLQNWLEIYNWITGLAPPSGDNQNYNLMVNQPPISPYKLYSDLHLYTLDSQRNPKMGFNFKHAYPVELGSLEFTTTVENTQYIKATVMFDYAYYDVFDPYNSKVEKA